MASLIFDTTFLIDFQRERKAKAGPAHDFLAEHADDYAYLPVTAYGEFCEGFTSPTHGTFLALVDSFELVPVTPRVAEIYASIARSLRAKGALIGTNDLWIAATALECGHPLVTRNTADFTRIPGLRVVGY